MKKRILCAFLMLSLVLVSLTGKMSITADTADNQLEVIVEDDGDYVKHFVGLSDNVTYVIEDLNLGDNDVSKYCYTLNLIRVCGFLQM